MTAPAAPSTSLWFLTEPDQHWSDNHEAWEREERRLYGGDHVLEELTPFAAEEPDSLDLRKRTARYYNIPDKHMSLISGHLTRAMPAIEFGALAGSSRSVRARKDLAAQPWSLAEILTYNCDGIGTDGTQLRTWIDGVLKRAGATGYRAILVEMPRAATLAAIQARRGAPATAALTEEDRTNGWHPYFAEYSPLAWTRRSYTEGMLDMAVLRLRLPPEGALDALTPEQRTGGEDGYYLMVRQGYEGLGRAYVEGGWWLYRSNLTLVEHRRWDVALRGQIPLVRAMAEHNIGTAKRPTIGRSLTMELGQIAIDLMNARSEQRYNARQAAKSVLFGLGMTTSVQRDVATQILAGNIVIAVPPVENTDGSLKLIPQMWASSSVALDTAVYTNIISEGLEEARQIMIAQVTSVPDSSGESKRAGFDEAVSPLLSRLAGSMETWINSLLAFYAMRAGVTPDASLQMPTAFKIQDLVSDINRMVASLKDALLSSPTWTADLMLRQGDEMGLLPDAKRAAIVDELHASVKRAGDFAAAEFWAKMANAVAEMTKIPGMTPQGAGYLLGLTPEQVEVLRNGVPPGETNDGSNAAPTQSEVARRQAEAAAAAGSQTPGGDGDEGEGEGEGEGERPGPPPEAAARGQASPAFQAMQQRMRAAANGAGDA